MSAIPGVIQESEFGKEAPAAFCLERATIASRKARVKAESRGKSRHSQNRFLNHDRYKKKRALAIAQILADLFPNPTIPLLHKDPYTLLIAVLLSAQCTDARVNLITPHLFALADTPEKMVQLTPSQIEHTIRTAGLAPTKARAIFALSHQLLTHHQGLVPQTFAQLEALPGVGHKTASVVLSQAFQIPAFPVDTHIHRSAKRWRLSSGTTVEATERDLKALYPENLWNTLHLQIIHFARKYCPAKGHNPENCPICSLFALKKSYKSKLI